MKTRRIEYWTNFSKFQANLEEYESDGLDQTLSQFYAFGNSAILPSMLLTSNRNGSSEYQGLISLLWKWTFCKGFFLWTFGKVAEIALVAARAGQFAQLLKTQVILILNFTRPPCNYLYLLATFMSRCTIKQSLRSIHRCLSSGHNQ